MKLSATLSAADRCGGRFVFTFGAVSNSLEEQVPEIGPISEPRIQSPLAACAKDVIAWAIIDDGMSLTDGAALFGEIYRLIPDSPGLHFTLADPAAGGPAADR